MNQNVPLLQTERLVPRGLSSMRIREFTEPDFPAVCKIYIEAKQDELQFERGNFKIIPLDQDAAILAAFRDSLVLVFEEEEVLGFAALSGNQLRAMFVARNARGKGVGQALLDATRLRKTELVLNVAQSNLGARKFYARNGFVVTGETVKMYADIAVTYIQMKSSWPAAVPLL